MFRCAWCKQKISDDSSLLGLNVQLADGVDFTENEGEIIQVFLESRHTSVSMIVTTSDSEAKKEGIDGVFTLCNDTCAEKMKQTLAHEKAFKRWS